MIEHYPVVVERETNGTFSAWVAGLPGVYAAAAARFGGRPVTAITRAEVQRWFAGLQDLVAQMRSVRREGTRLPVAPVAAEDLLGDGPERRAVNPGGPGSRCGMVCHMKTTLNIDDSVMQRLREEAARRGTTMSALVEAGLRRVLAPEVAAERDDPPPLPTWNSGGFLVDISDRDALYRAMEEDE